MKADFHVHTDISDSSYDLNKTLQLAKKNGVTHIAVTNHDTVEGLNEAIIAGAKEGIKVIPGVEISAYDTERRKKVHILGFNFDLEGINITKLCNPTLTKVNLNSMWQINELISNGYKINIQNILSKARNSKVIYKQHIMAELMEANYTDEIYSELYKKLFNNNGLCVRDIEYVNPCEAVRAIKKDNGIAVLAHPGELDSFDLIPELVTVGLDGIELNHISHSYDDIIAINKYKNQYNLILTGGSDFHGDYGTSKDIGEFLCPEEYIYIFDNSIEEVISINEIEDKNGLAENMVGFIKTIVKEAGEKLKKVLIREENLEFKNGDYQDIVTKYDFETEKFLISKIVEKYPNHSFITEEGISSKQFFSEYTWIIDPIDGTTNFVNMHKDFAISVALYKDKKPFVGMVYDVMQDKLFYGICGEGAFLNDVPLNKNEKDYILKDSIIDFSLNSMNLLKERKKIDLLKLAKDIRGHRSYGSASLSLCKIALGELQGYISAKLNLWDYAAGIIILRELGGYFSYFENANEDEFPLEPVIFVGASSKLVEKELIENLNRLKRC